MSGVAKNKVGLFLLHCLFLRQIQALLVAVFLVALVAFTAQTQPDATTPQEPGYLSTIDRYQRHFRTDVLEIFRDKINSANLAPSEQSRLVSTVDSFERTLTAIFSDFRSAYQKAFLTQNPDSAAVKEARLLQENLKLSIELAQLEMIAVIKNIEQNRNVNKPVTKLEDLTRALEENRTIRRPLGNYIANFFPRREKFLTTVLRFLHHAMINTPITTIMKLIPLEPFTTQRTPPLLSVLSANGERSRLSELPANAVIILAMNHDVGTLDGYGIQKISEALGANRNMVLTTKGAWPQFLFHKNTDPDAFLIEEKTFSRRLFARVNALPNERITFSAFPEGAVAMAGAQFPQIANAGIFKIARDMAARLQGTRPVYYIRLTSNFLEHVTSGGEVPMHIEIREPELVPTSPLEGRSDVWVREKRHEFENSSHKYRGRFYDLREPMLLEGSRLFRVGGRANDCRRILQ